MTQGFHRAYSLLKTLQPGAQISGFVKMEARAGKNTVTVALQGFRSNEKASLRAVLASRDMRSIAELGELTIDHRGQGSVQRVFEGDYLDGRRIQDYSGVCVIRIEDASSTPVLAGLLEGGARMDWYELAARAAGIELPRPGGARSSEPPAPERLPWERRPPEAVPRAAAEPVQEKNERSAPVAPEAPRIAEEPLGAPRAAQGQMAASLRDNDKKDQPASPTHWPERASEHRVLFESSQPFEVFEWEEGAAYVRVGMPPDIAGVDHYIMGIVVEEDSVKTIRYGIPGSQRAAPPPGLEGFRWRASNRGGGYWIAGYDAATGDIVE